MASFSIDVAGIFAYAADIVNAMMPIIALSSGLAFGFILVKKIGNLFKGAL